MNGNQSFKWKPTFMWSPCTCCYLYFKSALLKMEFVWLHWICRDRYVLICSLSNSHREYAIANMISIIPFSWQKLAELFFSPLLKVKEKISINEKIKSYLNYKHWVIFALKRLIKDLQTTLSAMFIGCTFSMKPTKTPQRFSCKL